MSAENTSPPAELKACCPLAAEVDQKARARLAEYKVKAKELLDHMDVTLKSEFNKYDLYREVVPCAGGDGAYWGVSFDLYSSQQDIKDYLTIRVMPGNQKLEVAYGAPRGDGWTGIGADTADKYNKFRIEKQVAKALQKAGCQVEIKKVSDKESTIFARGEADSVEAALDLADAMAVAYFFRVGLESRMFNLSKICDNVFEFTDDKLADWVKLDDDPRDAYEDVIILTATRICRRCTREWPDIVKLVQMFPQIKFGLAFLDKPKFKFMPKVFDEDCGEVRFGDKVTPFVIYYSKGIFQHYIATRKEEPPPALDDAVAAVHKHILAHRK